MLIALPSGLIVSGVATWAARLVSALAASGRAAGLVLHGPPEGHRRLGLELHPDVRVYDLSGLPRFEDVSGRSGPEVDSAREAWVGEYGAAARDLAASAAEGGAAVGAGVPVILSPNLHADCYAVCVEVARRAPELVRLVGWQHNDIEYDRRVLAHYAPALAGIVGVSEHIVGLLRGLMPGREIASLAYGVEVSGSMPVRAAWAGGRPVRLVYTGRLDHYQKRILALAWMSRALVDMGIAHELTILGDGPAAADLDRLIDELSRPALLAGGVDGPALPIARPGPATPAQVRAALASHDAFVLPSRFEGLSVSMLEALSAGCVPVVARVASGALQAIEDGATGLIADVGPDADERQTGAAMADGVARFLACDRALMARRAWNSARERFSIQTHARQAERVIDRAADAPPVDWPDERGVWFSEIGGSVPADARPRLARKLAELAGRSVLIHGTGLHTRTLLDQMLAGPARIVGFADDDRQRQRDRLEGLAIVGPTEAASLGATDVLISTSMHEDAVWARRAVYERRGLRVHRLYE